ncbi:MAG: hypothetical protein D6780_03925 [Candidatus Dadabacteria bacterium]|nr:MAG: hypothetical protein D6780_03925 [Candidatus Dadabacteria bacterium]
MKEKVKKALFFKISFLIFFCITEAFTALLFSFQANAQVGRARISPATPAVPDPAPELCELNGEQFYLQRNGLFRLNVNGSALSFSQIFSFPDHLKDNQREIYFFRNSDNPCLTFQGKMFFVLSKADSASIVTASIWQSDGTASGTFEVSSLAFPNKTPSEIIDAAVFNNSLYYLAKEKDTNNIYLLKWTNLSQPAQTLKAWVVPDDDPEFLPDASHLFAFNNYIAFRACDSINGCELWRTNGTPNGTETINEEGDPFDDGIGNSLIKIGDKLLFVDARPTSSTFGSLLALNTLTDSVEPLATGEITALHVNSSTDIDLPMRRHNNLVFAAAGITDIDSLFETTLWATDGTTEGTTRIKDFFYLDITSIGMPSLGNLFFFKGLDVQSNDSDISFFMQTFKTDGTVSNTSPVLLPTDNPYTNSIADFFYNFNGKIIFLGETESTTALWQTTGSLPSQIFNTQNSLLSYPDYLNFAEFAKAINNNLYLTVNESLALKINSSLNKLTLSDFLPPNPQVHYSSKTEILSTTPHIMVYSAYDFNSEKKELYYTKGKAGALKLNNLFPAGTEVGKVFSTTEDKQGNFFFFIQPRDSFSCSLWKSRTDAGTAEQIVTFP